MKQPIAGRWAVLAAAVLVIGCGPHNVVSDPHRSARPADAPLRVMTFNILNLYVDKDTASPWAWEDRRMAEADHLNAVADAVRSADPDVVGLQDVMGRGQAGRIAEMLGMNWAYTDHGNPKFEWGLAVLSRYPILSVAQAPIHPTSHRNAMVAQIDGPDGKVWFVNVHFHKVGYNDQVARTLALLDGREGPVLLAGSLNLQHTDPLLSPITRALADTCDVVRTPGSAEVVSVGTYPRRSTRVDYIFADREHFTVVDAGIVADDHRRVSDHLAYWADVAFR